jgi:hypothetical protein
MKDFIPYEQALELKELGFDEPCFGWYDGKYTSSINQDYCKNSEEWLNTIHCSAPLYQQAFRWCREKYDLISYIHPLALLQDTKKWCYEITNFESSWDEDINLYSPEEAELACLIKLIEIVKTK